MTSLPRRDIFRAMLAGVFPWHHAGLATSHDVPQGHIAEPAPPPPPPLPWQFDMGPVVELGARRKEVYIEPSTGIPTMRTVPRWEHPEHAGHPQPMPIATRVYRDPPLVAGGCVVIQHDWESEAAAEHCTRCRACHISRHDGHDAPSWLRDLRGVATCLVHVPAGRDVSDEDAPMYSQRDEAR